jgi:hypothetical protein
MKKVRDLIVLEKGDPIIISAFPGVGKTWLFNNQDKLGLIVDDSDSSKFSWLDDGITRNPDFPNNYIRHIMDRMYNVDIICVSSHEVVRNTLVDNKLNHIVVYPNILDKEIYIQRFKDRGSPENFIRFIDNNWENFIEDMEINYVPYTLDIQLASGDYLSNAIKSIVREII